MPVSYIPSAEKVVEQQKSTARKRRRNQNVEIEELGELLPFKPDTGKTLDKISVLRLTSSYIKFQKFMKSAYGSNERTNRSILTDLLAQAIDGFLLVLAGDATVLFASDSLQGHVGLNPRDVIGHSIHDLVQSEEDSETIRENLQPKGTDPNQYRMFYIRLKSSMVSGRGTVSRYSTHMMVQVSGHLKLRPLPPPSSSPSDETGKLDLIPRKPDVIGLIVECRLIEASPSILELSVPQTSFTTTIGLDTMKIMHVETKVKDVLGYDPHDFVGTDMCDFFHPSDCAKLIPCKYLLQRTGYSVSPIFRFMTSSGEWAWVQMEGLLRYSEETGEPQFLEVSVKIVSQVEGKLKYINQLEFYGDSTKKDESLLYLHRDPYNDMIPAKPIPQTHEPVVSGMKQAHVPESVIDTVLHSRELCLNQLPNDVTNVVSGKEEAEMVALQNTEFLSKVDHSQLLSERNLGMFDIFQKMKKLAADHGVSPPSVSVSSPSVRGGSSPPQSVSTAPSPSPSSFSQPGSVGSLQPSSVSAYAPSPSSNNGPHSIPSLAPSPNATSPPMNSPDSGIGSPTSATSDTGSVGNGTTNIASAGGSPSSQGRSTDTTYTDVQTPFQTTVVKSEFQTNSPEFQPALSPPTFSPDSVFTSAAPSYTFLPQNTAIPSSFQFGTQQQQQQQHQQQHHHQYQQQHQQQYQQQYQEHQQYQQQPPLFGDGSEEDIKLDLLLQNLTSQPQPPPPPPPQQQQQQQWLLQQQQLQQQIQQQQQVLQQLLQKQQVHEQQFPQQLLYQLPNGHSSSLSSSSSSSFSSSSSPVPSPYTPQSYGSAGPSPLPPQPTNAYQNGLMHTTDNSMQQNLSFAGSFSLLPQTTPNGSQFGMDSSFSISTEEQELLQQLQ